MNKTLLALALLSLATGCRNLGLGTNAPDLMGKRVYVMAGQSNMPGVSMDGALSSNPRILMYSMAHELTVAKDPLWNFTKAGQLAEPTLYVASESYGVGVSMPMAYRLIAHYPQLQPVLVPTAKGATQIDEWQPGTPLFETMIRRTRDAQLISKGTIGALIFWQGESDYVDEEHANVWAEKFTTMARAFRARVGNVPIVYVQIARTGANGPDVQGFRDTLRANQATVNLPYCKMVSLDGLDADHLGEHFTSHGYAVIAERIARELINIDDR